MTGKHLKILACVKIIAAQGPHQYKDMSVWELGYKTWGFFFPSAANAQELDYVPGNLKPNDLF